MSKVLFEEKQPFYQQPVISIGLMLFLVIVVFLYLNDFLLDSAGVVIIAVTVGILGMLFLIRLTTRITAEGIYYRMTVFHKQERFHAWSDIEHLEMRKYKALREYGGYGIRVGMHGTAFNIRGSDGLQLTLKSGKKILIGTQQPDNMTAALRSLRKLRS